MKNQEMKPVRKKKNYSFLSIPFWVLVWQLISVLVHNEIFLTSPLEVVKTLIYLAGQDVFWISIFHSFFKILFGLLFAVLAGIALSVLSYRSRIINELTLPLMRVIQATPVASFIILALLWVKSSNLSILCSFLMVLPVVYTNVLQGILSTDPKMLEMAQIFHMKAGRRIRYLYIPAIMPYFVSAVTVGLGLCWKAGIAAEVIGQPHFSIGEQLYEAKIYVMTDQLFAWTIVIILISVISEKLLIRLIRFIQNGWVE